jgi:DNA-binding NarL/FixJ family response regulator
MKILLADDHALFRAGLAHVLARLDEEVSVIEAGTFAQAREAAASRTDLDLALVDLYMPDSRGMADVAALIHSSPTLPVVVLSASERREDMQRALDAGALGFIPKAATPAVMLGALRLVLAGGVYVPPEMLRTAAGDAEKAHGLTPRQLEILARVIQGMPNKAIARECAVSEATVKAHVRAVFRALGVANRTQAAVAAEALKLKLPRC